MRARTESGHPQGTGLKISGGIPALLVEGAQLASELQIPRSQLLFMPVADDEVSGHVVPGRFTYIEPLNPGHETHRGVTLAYARPAVTAAGMLALAQRTPPMVAVKHRFNPQVEVSVSILRPSRTLECVMITNMPPKWIATAGQLAIVNSSEGWVPIRTYGEKGPLSSRSLTWRFIGSEAHQQPNMLKIARFEAAPWFQPAYGQQIATRLPGFPAPS